MVGDEAAALEDTGAEGDGGAAGADHLGEKLLGEEEGGLTDAVGDHEKPSGEAFLDFMEAIAGGDLTGEQGGVLHVLEHDPAHGIEREELAFEAFIVDAKGGGGDLDEAVVDGGGGTEEAKGFGRSFPADKADLDTLSVGHVGDHRGDAGGDEVDVPGGLDRVEEGGADGELYGFGRGQDSGAKVGRKFVEQEVGGLSRHRWRSLTDESQRGTAADRAESMRWGSNVRCP